MTAVTWFDGSTNQRHSAFSIPHFTFRIPHSAIPHFTHNLSLRETTVYARVTPVAAGPRERGEGGGGISVARGGPKGPSPPANEKKYQS